MNKDMHQIYEAYKSKSANLEIVEEGLFDRLKARGAQAVGAVKGMSQQALGGAQQLAGKAVGALGGVESGKEIQQAGQKKAAQGSTMGDVAKYESYVKNAVETTLSDLKKLNMPVKDENKLRVDLTTAIMGQLQQVTKSGQFRSDKGQISSKLNTQ
jgi:hypothetical protein